MSSNALPLLLLPNERMATHHPVDTILFEKGVRILDVNIVGELFVVPMVGRSPALVFVDSLVLVFGLRFSI